MHIVPAPVPGQLRLILGAEPTTNAAFLKVAEPRRVFWRAYLDWLATASLDEAEQFERVLCEHAHHVRPLMDAVSDALRTRESAMRLPHSLLVTLFASDWRPSAPPASSAAVPRNGWIAA